MIFINLALNPTWSLISNPSHSLHGQKLSGQKLNMQKPDIVLT